MKLFIFLNFCFCLFSAGLWAESVFPATPEAQEAIHWKNGYLSINGKPTYITSGEMHYARIPRELWKDRIWRAKMMGFNTIQMYVFWNATEVKDGVWDFTDNLDLDAWLTTIQEMGMYAIVRGGPYSCAEWEHGGFPAWLSIKPGMILRDNDPTYLRYVDRHLAKIYEIVAKHQINRGGNVIMAQLENEYMGGKIDGKGYLDHLYQKAREAGLQIPLFFSGLHHGGDPSGESPYNLKPDEFWFTTEFWTGWIGKYGEMDPAMMQEKIRGTWKIIAFGGAGYDYYVVHGGTNFGYSGDSFEASYDYSSPIGEAGQFRRFYYPARRAACFAQAFSSLLTSSENDETFAQSTQPGVRVTTRKSPQGSIIFVDHFQPRKDSKSTWVEPTAEAYKAGTTSGAADITTKLKINGLGEYPAENLVIHPHDIRTVVVNLPWTANASFETISTNILFRTHLSDKEVWVCYGEPGEYGEITLKKGTGNTPQKVIFNYPQEPIPIEMTLDSGDGKKILLLIMNTALTDRTWQVNDTLYVGAHFVNADGKIDFPPEGGKVTLYQSSGSKTVEHPAFTSPELPALANWSWRDAAPERLASYHGGKWLESEGPRPMETYDDFQNRYGSYRTTLNVPKGESHPLKIANKVGVFSTFVNGSVFDLDKGLLPEGEDHIEILAKIDPRPKLYAFSGLVNEQAAKGVWGPVSYASQPLLSLKSWKKHSVTDAQEGTTSYSEEDFNDQSWEVVSEETKNLKQALDKKTYWFRASFTLPEKVPPTFGYLPLSNNADQKIYINGQLFGLLNSKDETSKDFHALLKPGKNTIAIEFTGQSKSTSLRLRLELWPTAPVTPWQFHGGLDGLEETAIVGRVTNWEEFLGKPWQTEGAPEKGLPVFWKTTFNYHPKNFESLGLLSTGLSAGHLWLNGRNLGECPQKVPLYLPECWLKEGENNLVIFDLNGASPSQVKLQRMEAFERSLGEPTPH